MSRRLAELLAAANLAKLQDDQAAREGAASAANTGQWINALQSLVPAATGALDKYQGSVADDAKTAAEQAAADHTGDVGDAVDTPGQAANKALTDNVALNPKKPTGILDSLSSILGDREGAAAKAKAAAATKIASGIQANRATAAATADKAKAAALAEDEKAAAYNIEQQKIEQAAKDAEANRRNAQDVAHIDHPPKAASSGIPSEGKSLDLEKKKLEVKKLEQETTKKDEGQQVPATIAQRWGNMAGTANYARKLATDVKPEDFTVENRAMALLPLSMRGDRQKALAKQIDRFVQRAGVGLEGGKLAEGDIKRYRDMLVSAADDYDTFQTVAKQIAEEIDQQVADEKGGLSSVKFAVPTGTPSGSNVTRADGSGGAAADPLAGSGGW